EKVYSVSELNRWARHVLMTSIRELWVAGEISNLTIKNDSGHVYFIIKDANCQVNAVFWKGRNQALALNLQQGCKIEAFGKVDLFERNGNFQFSVSVLRPVGMGELFQRLEELRARLRAKGLFDVSRKRPLPRLPRCIGLVTSLEGAAIRDFMQILNRRHPNIHLRIINSPVQGQGAAAWLAAAVQYLDQSQTCDVIVVTRGGGSMEDLWEFNEEILVRAIAASETPIISAVGHERDYTLCDEVADFRAPTPSAAAELVVKARQEMQDGLQHAARRLHAALLQRLNSRKLRWQRADRCSFFRKPEDLIHRLAQRLDTASLRLEQMLRLLAEKTRQRMQNFRQRLPTGLERTLKTRLYRQEKCEMTLNALNPRKVLSRGYSILLTQEKRAVRQATNVAPGQTLRAILAEGELQLEVKEKTNHG
ncbi:MAG: exodeoxyribonuclease VII large subunit, partial [Lentisphaeria bacterium]